MEIERRIGLIVNPIAGMGGAAGLRGTDGDRAARARARGAKPLANQRCLGALATITGLDEKIEWLTAAGSMGAEALDAAGFRATTIFSPEASSTSASDTRRAARAMLDAGADLILFAGGDGTAADLLGVVDRHVPILGIPAGVKMHSAVFAVSPRAAGDVVRAFVETRSSAELIRDAEIMDRTSDDASPELLGYAKTPVVGQLVARGKAAAPVGSVEGACRYAVRRIREHRGPTLVGPGTTMLSIKQALGMDGTLLGVDAFFDARPAGTDLSASGILDLLDAFPDPGTRNGHDGRGQAHGHDERDESGQAHSGQDESECKGGQAQVLLVVGVVGGQGFLFGRGNQQLSLDVLRRIDRDRIVIVSSMEKLMALPERQLFVDTGDESMDASLTGYLPVVIGERQSVQIAITAPHFSPPPDENRAAPGSIPAAANSG